MRPECINDQRGIALTEIIVAGVILATVVIGIALMFSRGKGDIDWQGERRIALTLAQDMIERIKAGSFDGVSTFNGLNECPPTNISGTPMDGTGGTPDYRNFRRQVTVEYVDDADFSIPPAIPPSNSEKVTVTVSSTLNHFYGVVLQTVVTRHSD